MYYDLNEAQLEQLLKPLNGTRVAKRTQSGKQLSYLEAWDVKAHMNRIFGITGWSWDVTEATIAFEGTVLSSKGGENWNVGYKVIGSLRVCGATYTEAAVGSASLPSRGDAHDMACKTAESDAFKRAAINLGDQFGLSLYNNGSLRPVVGATLATQITMERLSNAVAELVEVPVASPDEQDEAQGASNEADAPQTTEGAEIIVEALREAMADGDVPRIVELKQQATKDNALEWLYEGKTVGKMIDLAVVHAGKVAAGREALGGEEVQS